VGYTVTFDYNSSLVLSSKAGSKKYALEPSRLTNAAVRRLPILNHMNDMNKRNVCNVQCMVCEGNVVAMPLRREDIHRNSSLYRLEQGQDRFFGLPECMAESHLGQNDSRASHVDPPPYFSRQVPGNSPP
jgi:hypothetical protein